MLSPRKSNNHDLGFQSDVIVS